MVDSRINSPGIKKLASKRVLGARFRLILKRPFYGNLLLHLKFSLAKCGTAATDMRRIMFDPEFVISLTDAELDFVLMHEVMHCALQHCVRGKNKNQYFYNIACDIVVNSNILQTMGVSSFCVDGAEIIHLTPESKAGFLYSAEEVYEMLIKKYDALKRDFNDVQQKLERDYGVPFDAHDIWNLIPTNDSLSNEWKEYMSDSAKKIGTVECPPGIREMLEEIKHESKVDWRIVLSDFVKTQNDRYDFLFLPPDRRFSTDDFLFSLLFQKIRVSK